MGVGVALMEVRVISKQQRAVTAEERSDGAMQTTTSRRYAHCGLAQRRGSGAAAGARDGRRSQHHLAACAPRA